MAGYIVTCHPKNLLSSQTSDMKLWSWHILAYLWGLYYYRALVNMTTLINTLLYKASSSHVSDHEWWDRLETTVTMQGSVQSISVLCFTGDLRSCFITFLWGYIDNKRIPAKKRTYVNARDIEWEGCLITSQTGRSISIHGQLALIGLSQPLWWTVLGVILCRILRGIAMMNYRRPRLTSREKAND